MRSSIAPELVAPVARSVDGLVGRVGRGAVRDLTHEEMTGLVVELRRLQARLEATVLEVVGEVDARGSYVHDGALTASGWLRMHTRATPAEASASVRTAKVLRSDALPETRKALSAGEITPRHAQVIALAVEGAPPGASRLIEPDAVAVAREADVRAVSGVMRQFQHALDPDDADEAAVRRYDRRGFSLAPMLDGSVVLSGLADEVSGSLIATAVSTAAPPEAGDKRTAAQRRLDGLAEIARRFLESPDAPRVGGGGHPHVIVTVDAETLGDRAASGETGGRLSVQPAVGTEPLDTQPPMLGSPGATLSWVGHIAGSTARRVACDAEVTTVRLDHDGEVVSTRTDRRFFTPAQRRAMIARDGDRCCVPFCDRPVDWADGHHLRSWQDGGPTTVANGALPCAGHHQLLHEGHWILLRHQDGRYSIRHPDGREIGPEPYPPGHNRPPPHRVE